jgi:hypothetical protein
MWLFQNFGVKTSVGLNSTDRARVINALNNYVNEFAGLPTEDFGSEAMAA